MLTHQIFLHGSGDISIFPVTLQTALQTTQLLPSPATQDSLTRPPAFLRPQFSQQQKGALARDSLAGL